ncbi:MAG: lysine--tRNA ligase [Actinomycetota bacterium]
MNATDDNYPYRYERTAHIGELRERHDELEPGAETTEPVHVAGRMMSVRGQGKAAFADLRDASGRIQLFARQNVLGDEGMESFKSLGVGDIVGVIGEVIKTRRGELSINVRSATLLAPCLRPMPDQWHGMTHVETRYRQRYLDLLLNPSARGVVEARARANSAVRGFLEGRGFIEVETPLLQPIASGAVARPFVTHHNALDIDLYLRVAPELYLKRLLVGGLERVYELNRSFRNEGVSTQHNPEFVMLEAYEAYADYEDTMALVEELVRAIAEAVNGSVTAEIDEHNSIDLGKPFARTTIFEAIEQHGGVDLEAVWRAEDWTGLGRGVDALGVHVDPAWSPGKVVLEAYEAVAERKIVEPTFVVGFPRDVSPLAKDHRSLPGFTEHSDLTIKGMEIAPIYSELNDPAEQRRRFEQQAAQRSHGDEEAMVADEDFLEALGYGMPPAGGFGLGMERLVMILLNLPSLREVILFPTLKPDGGRDPGPPI